MLRSALATLIALGTSTFAYAVQFDTVAASYYDAKAVVEIPLSISGLGEHKASVEGELEFYQTQFPNRSLAYASVEDGLQALKASYCGADLSDVKGTFKAATGSFTGLSFSVPPFPGLKANHLYVAYRDGTFDFSETVSCD